MALSPKEQYVLEKATWTEADFEKMGWHDVVIHGLSFNLPKYELLFDIDYIFAWVDPEPPSQYFSFWISPATLVFRNVHDLRVEMEASLGLQLQGIERSNERVPRNVDHINKKEWEWTLDANEGKISFYSTSFTQFTRFVPRHWKKAQSFLLEEREGISFERIEKPKEI